MRTFARGLTTVSAAGLVVLACGASDDQGAPSTGSSGAPSSSGQIPAEAGASSSSGAGSSSGGPTGGHVGIDIGGGASSSSSSSSGEPDAGPPPLACKPIEYATQTTAVTCSAGRIVAGGGGTIVEGTYVVSNWWGCAGFGQVKGSAFVYRENGTLAMRYRLGMSGADAGAETQDTWTLGVAPNGGLVRARVCSSDDVLDEGGSYQVAGVTLTMHFVDHDEAWTLVASTF